ncbi:hypothetical protein JW710_04960 [Candidatus Dojkabacteria bacterium]|nr:hypothetical protein [Candidatus Dojkabacteria bacterium]
MPGDPADGSDLCGACVGPVSDTDGLLQVDIGQGERSSDQDDGKRREHDDVFTLETCESKAEQLIFLTLAAPLYRKDGYDEALRCGDEISFYTIFRRIIGEDRNVGAAQEEASFDSDDKDDGGIEKYVREEVGDFLERYALALKIPPERIDVIKKQIVAKTMAFCGCIGCSRAGMEVFVRLMKLTSVVYLLDQTIDRCDDLELLQGYMGAIEAHLLGRDFVHIARAAMREEVAENKFKHMGLWLGGGLDMINDLIDYEFPDIRYGSLSYQRLMRELAFREVLTRQWYLRERSIEYERALDYASKSARSESVNLEWKHFVVDCMVRDVGLQFIACGVDMILQEQAIIERQKAGGEQVPEEGNFTTPLFELLATYRRLILILEGFLRACDDFGDREADAGRNINMFNDGLVSDVLEYCGIDPARIVETQGDTIEEKVLRLFYQASIEELERIGVHGGSEDLGRACCNLPHDHKAFISFLLAVMKGGFVNVIGDVALTEGVETMPEEAQKILRSFGFEVVMPRL